MGSDQFLGVVVGGELLAGVWTGQKKLIPTNPDLPNLYEVEFL